MRTTEYFNFELEEKIKLFLIVLGSIVVFSLAEFWLNFTNWFHILFYKFSGFFISGIFSSLSSQLLLLLDKFILFLVAILIFYIFSFRVMIFFWILSFLNVMILYILGVYFKSGVTVVLHDLDLVTKPIFFDILSLGIRENLSLIVLLFGFLFFRATSNLMKNIHLAVIFSVFILALMFNFINWNDVLIAGIVGWFMSFFLYVLVTEFRNFNRVVHYILLGINITFALFVLVDGENYYFDTYAYILLILAVLGYSIYYLWLEIKKDILKRHQDNLTKRHIINNIRAGINKI